PNDWVGGISGKQYAKLTSKKSNYPLLNRAIQGQAPAGSVFKIVSASAAVRAGYPFDGRYDCSSSYSLGSQTFANFESKGHGPITLGDALKYSCNTVFYRLGHQEWSRDGGIKPRKDAKNWFYTTARD
nr:penicillin-binding transpeptidase domain-containing protein [Streptomyces sp. DSM 41633]